ncbi:hypothetical protein [Brevundimonas sp. M20]|uniref:hypothetical protein n=1 Tax=Brevundimonas sp. M20 TaxID=2591463 RepID=UPI00114674F9|nr:hypothetical protein [Brevundimonas sp. M20]QDH73294.1 hypothetical protein FKQ52_07555 [Brevundimonas sp. M20]
MTQPPCINRTHRPEDVWTAIRHDYCAGASTLLLAERYDLADRSIRRRAALENWRRDADTEALRPRPRDQRGQEEQVYPALAQIDDLNRQDLHDLLFTPDVTELARFAFRRAAECAALDGPVQTAAWLRVARLTTDLRDRRADLTGVVYRDADYIRAEMMHEHSPPDEQEDG